MTFPVRRRLRPALLALGLLVSVVSLAHPVAADEVVEDTPMVTVSPTTDLDPSGSIVTIEGSGFGGDKGVYVRLCAAADGDIGTAAGRPGAGQCASNPQHWVAATVPPATAPMTEAGTFSVTLEISRYFRTEFQRFDCAAVQCGIATRRDHNGGLSDYSLDTFTPVSFDAGPYFADVADTHAFFDEIQWMFRAGVSTGGPDPEGSGLVYLPGAAVKRQAMAALLHRVVRVDVPVS